MNLRERAAAATHTYIGRYPACGCCVAATVDYSDRRTAQYVAGFIRDGLTVERVTHEEFKVMHFGCEHQAERKAKQRGPQLALEVRR